MSQQANTGGSVLEVSVWSNEVTPENDDTIEVHVVSLKRSYKRDGEWETPNKLSLRQQDLLAAAHLLQKAYDFCQEDGQGFPLLKLSIRRGLFLEKSFRD
jgi:hypothetical protein